MIAGIGIDIVEIERIKGILERQDAFPKRILTQNEYDHCVTLSKHRQVEFLAGRFASKEAFSKAVGTGIGKETSFQDIEILPNEQNQPLLTSPLFSGASHVSISHSETYVIAQVILENPR